MEHFTPMDQTTAQEEARDETSAAAAAEEYVAAQQPQLGDFSMELNQDQKDIRDWVHGFAADVVRPAAAEWDEREETPWPIIQEAAKIGLYGFEGIAQFWADPTGITFPIVNEELFWATPASACRSWARLWPWPGSCRRARPSSSASGSRSASAPSRSRRWAPSACRSRMRGRMSRLC